MNAAQPATAILRLEHVIDYLREQLQDAREGMSLRSPDEVQRELTIAEAKIKRLRSIHLSRLGEPGRLGESA